MHLGLTAARTPSSRLVLSCLRHGAGVPNLSPPSNRQMDPVHVFAASSRELEGARNQLQAGPLEQAVQAAGSKLEFVQDNSLSLDTFEAGAFFGALTTASLGHVLLTSQRTTSTQVLLQDSLRSLPDGVVFVADRQSIGKGRGGNVWDSPDGCLMVSAAMRLTIPGQRLPFLQYLISLAVIEAVRQEAMRCLKGISVDVRLKWPNDIYSDGVKIGGILCHSTYRDHAFHLVWGLGLNVSNHQPTTCLETLFAKAALAKGIRAETPRCETLLAYLVNWLEPAVEKLAVDGFAHFRPNYLSAWLHTGQCVDLEENGTSVPVVIRGLTEDGYLLAEEKVGDSIAKYELHPDGNSLDFFKGLVRKKLPSTLSY